MNNKKIKNWKEALNKGLVKKCSHCKKYYLATKPHWEKSSKCPGLEMMMKDFRRQNKIPPYEVWNLSISTDDYMIMPQYNERETLRNFMRLVYKKPKCLKQT